VLSLLSLSVLLGAFASSAQAQNRKALEKVRGLNNPFSTNKITVYYSPGYKKRALELRALIEGGMQYYEEKLNLRVELSVAVLNQLQWNQVDGGPYGLPWVSSPPYVAFLPATPDGVVTASTLSLKKYASPALLKEIKSSGYSYEKASEEFVDLIGLHELGHVYAIALGLRPPYPSKWFSEFLASYFAYAYLRERHAMTADLLSTTPRPKYTTLTDFERLEDMDPGIYNWYQSKFVQRVGEVYEKKGLSFFSDVRRAFPPEPRQLTLEIVLQRLEQISPGFIDWSNRLG
jgi:hypothetical protein